MEYYWQLHGKQRTACHASQNEGEETMNIYVLLKQTFDTEEKIVLQDGKVREDGAKFIINPYDEYALEEAIRTRDAHGGTVIAVSVGPERAVEALRTALAMGADEAVLIDDQHVSDEYGISRLLAAYMSARQVDLLFAGYFSVDNGAGQVAIRVAELLGIPHVSSVTKLNIDGKIARCERDAEGDVERVEVGLPAMITAQQGLNEPRYPSLPGIMRAKRKPLQRLTAEDLGLQPEELMPQVRSVSLSLPAARRSGRILKGELQEQVQALIRHLHQDDRVI
jgi:electron transfer flavoprotein beta subunit